MENLVTIKNNLILKQSVIFSDVYERVQKIDVQTFNEVSINDIDGWYNSLLTKYDFLNLIQIQVLQSFFKELKNVLFLIDPLKLNIKDDIIEDVDLLLWRESSNGISKLVFDEFGQVIYMFNGNDGSKKKGVFDSLVDMEKLLYRFISL